MFSMLSKRRFQKHDDGLGSHFFQQRVPSSLLFFSKKNLRKMNWNVVFESFSITFGKTGKMDHFQVLMNRHLFSNGKQNKLPKWRQNTWISCCKAVLPTWNMNTFAKKWWFFNFVHNFHYISNRLAHFSGFQFLVEKREKWPISRREKTEKSRKTPLLFVELFWSH